LLTAEKEPGGHDRQAVAVANVPGEHRRGLGEGDGDGVRVTEIVGVREGVLAGVDDRVGDLVGELEIDLVGVTDAIDVTLGVRVGVCEIVGVALGVGVTAAAPLRPSVAGSSSVQSTDVASQTCAASGATSKMLRGTA
jgi:hypothetical protein